jgi:uncharacterized protein (TIGR03492 family)
MSAPAPDRPVDILLVSNGFGEFAIATYIAQAIRALAPAARIEHLPLVGRAPDGAWPPPVGPQREMPSGGLVTYWNVRNLMADLSAGLGGLTVRQYGFLRRQRRRDVVIAVGDVYCLSLCLLAARRPTVFVATAKSDHVAPHSALERAIARRAAVTFARDAATARSLGAAGVRARYAGNVMMDGLRKAGLDLGVRDGALVIAVLPGSRADAPQAAADMVRRLEPIAQIMSERGRAVQAFFSIAPSVDAASVAAAMRAAGIALTEPAPGEGVIARGLRRDLDVALVRGAFGDLLESAEIVLGQAGTANEQAAGYGRPVVAAAQPGEAPDKMHWYRMRQKRLLEDALLVLPAEPASFARDVIRLIDDPQRMRHMADVGRERMGSPGAAAQVAAQALAIAQGTDS